MTKKLQISRSSWIAAGVGVAAIAAMSSTVGLADSGNPTHTSNTATASSTFTPGTASLAAPAPVTPATPASTAAPVTAAASADSALQELQTLPVKGRAPKTGYSRAQFGQAWSDDVTVADGHNGCDTRNDILRRDLTAVTIKPGSNGCAVLTGTLHDAYTGKTIAFTRGRSTSDAVQIDHMVALSNAWQTGAQQLSADERRNLANDPRNLEAVDGSANEQKGDGDAATWLPPNTSYRCTYVSRQIDVKVAYRLWVTQSEKDAMTRILTNCGATPPETSAPAEATPATTHAPTPAVTPARGGGSSVYYSSCKVAKAAGAAPILRGQPGYRTALDRNGDGVACEG